MHKSYLENIGQTLSDLLDGGFEISQAMKELHAVQFLQHLTLVGVQKCRVRICTITSAKDVVLKTIIRDAISRQAEKLMMSCKLEYKAVVAPVFELIDNLVFSRLTMDLNYGRHL